MDSTGKSKKSTSKTWRSLPADLTDEEWELIADLVPTYSGGGRMGRPPKWSKRQVVDAILYVAATGCQWRALPPQYPHWNTVAPLPSDLEPRRDLGEDRGPSPGSWYGPPKAASGTRRGRLSTLEAFGGLPLSGPLPGDMTPPRRYRARKTFGLVDTGGLLLAVAVVAANPLGQRRWDSSRRPGRYQIPAPQEDMARQRIQEILRHPLLRVRYHLPSREQGLRSLL